MIFDAKQIVIMTERQVSGSMTIDEEIAYQREKAKEQRRRIGTWDKEYSERCEKWAEEHEQLAEWLEELKKRRSEDYGYLADIHQDIGYRKAIDDFVKEICKMIVQSENNGNHRFYAVEIKQAIADLAERLKAGGRE